MSLRECVHDKKLVAAMPKGMAWLAPGDVAWHLLRCAHCCPHTPPRRACMAPQAAPDSEQEHRQKTKARTNADCLN